MGCLGLDPTRLRLLKRAPPLHAAVAQPVLEIPDHAEEILSLRITARPEYPHQAFRLHADRPAQFLKADRRPDIAVQDRLGGVDIVGQHGIDPFRSSVSPKAASFATRRYTRSLKLRVSAILFIARAPARTKSAAACRLRRRGVQACASTALPGRFPAARSPPTSCPFARPAAPA